MRNDQAQTPQGPNVSDMSSLVSLYLASSTHGRPKSLTPSPFIHPSIHFLCFVYNVYFTSFSTTTTKKSHTQERLSILSELENHLVELSQVLYAHFIVMRLFKESKGAEERNRVVKAFRGQVVKLATHSIGARVVQTALESLPVAAAVLIKVCGRRRCFSLVL